MSSRLSVPIVSVIGVKNSGKTTLIERLVSTFEKDGYRVGVMKYALREFQVDHEGKDTYRFYHAGAYAVGITSHDKMAVIKRVESPPPLDKILETHFSDADIVLLEGYRGCDCPRICLIVPGKESVDSESTQDNKDCPILRLNVSGQNSNPISPEALEKAADFVRGIIEGRRR